MVMAAVVLAVVYPIGYGLWHASLPIAALPLAIAGAIWVMLQVAKPRWPAAEPFVARHPTLASLLGAAALLAIIAAGGAAVLLLRAP
jgi:hypothetical protein